jgi:S1-C subfamily serine protease
MWVTVGSGEGKGLSIRVEGERFLIGTGEECQLMLGDPKVDPLHAYFQVLDDGHVELHDLGSRTGTFVNGDRIDGPRRIEGGEDVRVGDTLLMPTVQDPAEEIADRESPSTEPEPVVRVTTEGQTVEVVPTDGVADAEPDDATSVRVTTEGEAVEVIPARERRRLREMSTAGVVAAGAALSLAVAGVIVALSAGGGSQSAAGIVSAVKPATVFVHANLGKGESMGTGWVLDGKKGLIATDFHVIDGGNAFAVGKGDSEQPATLVGAAPCDDLAVLRVSDTKGLKTMPLGSQKGLNEGESVVAIGYPANASLRDNLTSTAGVVSVVRSSFRFPTPDSPQYSNMIQTDAALSPGNSGGPLVDDHKQLVGVNTAILTGIGGEPVQGQGYAIGVDRVKQLMPDLRRGRSHGWAGFAIAAPKKGELAGKHLPPGVFIGAALPGTPAYAAGLRQAPVLVTRINGLRLQPAIASYCDAVREVAPGQTAVMTLVEKAGAKPRQVSMTFR